MKRIAVILLILALLAGCSTASNTAGTETTTQPATQEVTETQTDPVADLLAQMTLEEKVGQLFMIRPESVGITNNPTQISGGLLAKYHVGGFVLAQSNLVNENQIIKFNAALTGISPITPFISVDEEGGTVARFANHDGFNVPQHPSAHAIGLTGDPVQARVMGRTIGTYLKKYGVNMNLAPVADVNTNPDNPVIGIRAFSSEPEIAATMAQFMAAGLKDRGIIPVYKHFPGHGDTAEDSHAQLAVSYKTLEELQSCEWVPYEKLTEKDCVMIAHVALPNVTGDMTPATMSYQIVTEILRQQLGFNGLVMTDAMEMGAIVDSYSSGEAAVNAISAGCDMILGPADFEEAYNAVLEAVQNGTLTEERIDESVYRILWLKQAYGLL